jgi:hypothetical protein
MMKRSRIAAPEPGQAEDLGMRALLFVAGEPTRLGRFLADTGLSPQELRHNAGEPAMLAAILEHLLGNESELLVFAAEAGVDPQLVEPMRALLAGEKQRWEPSA